MSATASPPRPTATYREGWTDRIPAELKARRQWVVWRFVWRLNKRGEGKWTKVPFQVGRLAGTRRKARPNDRKTWGSYEAALAAYLEYANHPDPDERLDGIGFMFGPDDPYCGVDFDRCLVGELLADWAEGWLRRLGPTYYEVSPSGEGLKAFYVGSLPPKPTGGTGRRRAGYGDDGGSEIEAYCSHRFFTLTGDVMGDALPKIAPADPEALAALVAELDEGTAGARGKGRSSGRRAGAEAEAGPPPSVDPAIKATLDKLSDEDLLKWARHSKNGRKFTALYDGGTNGHPSPSEADEALLALLAFWTGGDAPRMERLFGGSARADREKWDRADYRRMSIDKAIRFNGGRAPDLRHWHIDAEGILRTRPKRPPERPRWEGASGDGERRQDQKRATKGGESTAEDNPPGEGFGALSDEDMGIVPLSSVQSYPVRWLWEYRLARGNLALLAGDGGLGKSMLLLYIAALVSKGGPWPDGKGNAPLGQVVIVSAEDRPDDTIRPRLEAMGADLSRIFIVKAKFIVRPKDKTKPPQVHPASFQDRGYWKEVLRRLPDCRLFIADPLPSYLGRGVNDSKSLEVRAILEPFLEDVIAPADVCMIGNTHLNKSSDAKTVMHRLAGTQAYGNLPRNVHFVARDPQIPARRFFSQEKCNNAPDNLPAIAFRVETRQVKNHEGQVIETAIPIFEAEPVAVDMGEILNGHKKGKRGPEPKTTNAAAEWLFDYLAAEGSAPLAAIFDAAGAAGFAGSQKPDGRWSNVGTLYRAMEAVPSLDPPRAGKVVSEFEDEAKKGGRKVKHWTLKDMPF